MSDLETCSHCTEEVEDSTLIDMEDGSRLDGPCMVAAVKEGLFTWAQDKALVEIHQRYGINYNPDRFRPTFDLPPGYLAGWVGSLYIGISPKGDISS